MLATALNVGASRLRDARLLALLVPAALLGGALFSQYVGGLYPCEMCYWQRWPHAAAILLAIGAFLSPLNAPRSRTLVLLAALAIANAANSTISRGFGVAGAPRASKMAAACGQRCQ